MKTLLFFFALCYGTALYAQEIEITFESDGLEMAGTLTLPDGEGPFPCVILVHGSGPNDRDQTIALNDPNSACLYPELIGQTIKNFRDISEHLSDCGIASLRYDKRTFTHAAVLDPVTISPYDFINDIVSAIYYVEGHPEIDPAEIYLAGHSQGSTLIPVAANLASNVKGLISLAGPTTPVDSLLPEQYRHIYEFCANDPPSGEFVANQFYSQFQQIRNNTFPDNGQVLVDFPGNPNNPVSFGYETFWKDWINLADSVIFNYNSLNDIPTLIIHGDEDINVPIEDVDDFESGLTTDELSIATFEGVTHFLTPQNTGSVDSNLLSTICEWINSLVTSTGAVSNLERITYRTHHDGVMVTLPEQHHFNSYSVFDLNGRSLQRQKINSTTINIQNLNTGHYVVAFHEQNNTVSLKIWTP